MAVIAHLRIQAHSFELGRILNLDENGSIELETMVPMDDGVVPFLKVSEEVRDSFEKNVGNHPSVNRIIEVTCHDGERLYSLDWESDRDVFFHGIVDLGGQLLNATGTAKTWEFEIRFLSHEILSEFQEYCVNANISIEVGRIYNPTRPETGMWYGVTEAQRETLMRAVRGGYYSIPRRLSTQELADELGISDQAVTERLRRAIETLTRNTLIVVEEELEDNFEQVQ